MKKIALTLGLLAICTYGSFAQMYMTRTGKISFNATASGSPEKIEAVTNESSTVLNMENGMLAFQLLVKSFKFERALMQEHFNENYMESDKYPKANFTGKITNTKDVKLDKDGIYNVTAEGKMMIHGAVKDISVPGTITVKGSTLKLKAKFNVKLADYNIQIPTVVADKVGKEAVITLESDAQKK